MSVIPIRSTLACALITMFVVTSGAAAQQTEARLSVDGGRATDATGVTASALTVSPVLALVPDANARFELGGAFTRFANQAWSAGLGASSALRAPMGKFAAATLDLSGSWTMTSYDLTYGSAGAVPALELRGGPLFAFAGARAAVGNTVQQQRSAGPLGMGGTTSATRATRSALGPVVGAGASFVGPDDEQVTLALRQERVAVGGVIVTDQSASLTAERGIVSITGYAGMRRAADERGTFASASLGLALSPSLRLDGSAGTYPSNRLTGTPGGRFVNVGLSLSTGRSRLAEQEPRLPMPEGIRAPDAGVTRLSLRAPDATRVEVAGDFNGWNPQPAHRAANGVWYVDLRLDPGRYRYAFKVNGAEWRVPDGAVAVEDEFGGKSAWLTVGETSRGQ